MLLGCDYGGLSGGPERDDHDAGRGLDFSEVRGDGREVIAGSAPLGVELECVVFWVASCSRSWSSADVRVKVIGCRRRRHLEQPRQMGWKSLGFWRRVGQLPGGAGAPWREAWGRRPPGYRALCLQCAGGWRSQRQRGRQSGSQEPEQGE